MVAALSCTSCRSCGSDPCKEDTLGRGGLTGVNVGGDPDISRVFKISACHILYLLLCWDLLGSEVGEGFVGFRPSCERLLFLNGSAFIIRGGYDLGSQLSAMDLPERLRLYPISHLMDKEIFLSGRISVGIWKLAPPIRRLLLPHPEWSC